MANRDLTASLGHERVTFANGVNEDQATVSSTDASNTRNIAALRTYLAGQGYTTEQLNTMSKNDMIFAYRQKAGIRYQ